MAANDSRTANHTESKQMQPEEKKSRKPGNTAFKQQRLPAWQPILTAGTVLPAFFLIGIIFVPLGVGFLVTSNKVDQIILDYTECEYMNATTNQTQYCDDFWIGGGKEGETCYCSLPFELTKKFSGQVFLYYRLTNYYQNHRRYVNSRDDLQFLGRSPTSSPSSDCAPYRYNEYMDSNNDTKRQSVAPCGAIANSIFNDSFTIIFNGEDSLMNTEVPMNNTGLAWRTDIEGKFNNPPGDSLQEAFAGTSPPPNWQKNITQMENGYENEEFIVWMRTAALPTFRKLHRKIFNQPDSVFDGGLPRGNYTLNIAYSYPVHQFGGTKSVVLTTTSWLGGKNSFLGIAYIVTGSLCILFGIFFLIIHIKHGKSTPLGGSYNVRPSSLGTVVDGYSNGNTVNI
ncbi:cell cycle control protein 50A-like [Amphiura filiformis]|uniref:cell cycle control protein 50A-like n=1 Tax=Amphiura filiformis TaxID=82378 RepID=UPI003B2179D1